MANKHFIDIAFFQGFSLCSSITHENSPKGGQKAGKLLELDTTLPTLVSRKVAGTFLGLLLLKAHEACE